MKLDKGNGTEHYMAHVLVWEAHNGELKAEGHDIHHVNGKESDNRVQNLRCLTRKEHFAEHVRMRAEANGTDSQDGNRSKPAEVSTKDDSSVPYSTKVYAFYLTDDPRFGELINLYDTATAAEKALLGQTGKSSGRVLCCRTRRRAKSSDFCWYDRRRTQRSRTVKSYMRISRKSKASTLSGSSLKFLGRKIKDSEIANSWSETRFSSCKLDGEIMTFSEQTIK